MRKYFRAMTIFPQSNASKEFHLKRAADKRARKAAILHVRVATGAMEYSDRHLAIERALRPSGFILRNARGEKIQMQPAPTPVPEPASNYDNLDIAGYTVSDLLDIGRQRGLKVTTKMTKAKLIEVIQAG